MTNVVYKGHVETLASRYNDNAIRVIEVIRLCYVSLNLMKITKMSKLTRMFIILDVFHLLTQVDTSHSVFVIHGCQERDGPMLLMTCVIKWKKAFFIGQRIGIDCIS